MTIAERRLRGGTEQSNAAQDRTSLREARASKRDFRATPG